VTGLEAVALVCAGMATGFINTLAGGGTVIALPVLEWTTGSPLVANATNRIAITLQNVIAVAGFGKAVRFRLAIRLTIPSVAGGLCGAYVASILDASSMRVALSIAVVFVALTAVVRPPRTPPLKSPWTEVAFFLCGFYAGFIQAGVGFLLLACLAGGLALDLVRANAVKVFIVLFTTIPALFVFGLKGQLWIGHGLVLACGNMGGAWIAARMAVKKGAAWVRIVYGGGVDAATCYTAASSASADCKKWRRCPRLGTQPWQTRATAASTSVGGTSSNTRQSPSATGSTHRRVSPLRFLSCLIAT
jgi:uncharacterized membrane protein YfcA